jgi:peptide/nickel transport system permease protein
MFVVLFAIKLGWVPTSGMATVGAAKHGFAYMLDVAHHLILPAITLSLFYMALYTRLMRAAVLENLRMNYVVTAQAKGVPPRRIVLRHVLRNAALPVVTMAGVQVGGALGGSVVVESVFGWPGLGLLAFDALLSRDLNLLLGILTLSSIVVVLVNLVVDLTYSFIDPRVALG